MSNVINFNSPDTNKWSKRTPVQNATVFIIWLICIAFVVWCFQVMTKETIWEFIYDAPRQAQDIGARMFPPNWASMNELGGHFGKHSISRR